jgi:hypothetical protein
MQLHWSHDFIAWWGCWHSNLFSYGVHTTDPTNYQVQVGCMKDGCPVGEDVGQVRGNPVITVSWLNIFFNSWTFGVLTTHPSYSAFYTLQIRPCDAWLNITEGLRADSSCYHKWEVILSCRTTIVNCWLTCHVLTSLLLGSKLL